MGAIGVDVGKDDGIAADGDRLAIEGTVPGLIGVFGLVDQRPPAVVDEHVDERVPVRHRDREPVIPAIAIRAEGRW